MAFFNKKIGCVFLKEDSDAETFIKQMTELLEKIQDDEIKKDIQKQIKLAKLGLYGENNIAFELKNSGLDMYVIHDICLEYNDLRAQIDYLIVTRKRIYVIECKNLVGDIEIDNNGNFIRTYEFFGKKIKEGLYSPVTQNQRHLSLIKQMRSPSNIIHKHLFEKNFEHNYKSLVVLSNPKTYLNNRFAKKEIKNQVIRADALIAYIKETDSKDDYNFSNEEMLNVANSFLEKNIVDRSDYAVKYKEFLENIIFLEEKSNTEITEKDNADINKICPRCGAKLILRTAKKGDKAGSEFYGCSNFPKCRFIENIN